MATMHINVLKEQSLNGQQAAGFKLDLEVATKALRKANVKLAKFFDDFEEVEERTTKALSELRDYLTTQIDERNK